MPYGSSSAAGDVCVARTGSPITPAMQPSAALGETSGPYPQQEPVPPWADLLLPDLDPEALSPAADPANSRCRDPWPSDSATNADERAIGRSS
jgi:hypothetical protein